MVNYALVDGFTEGPDDLAVAHLTQAVTVVGGVTVDFAVYPGRAIRLTVELNAEALLRLQRALAIAGVELFASCSVMLERVRRMNPHHPIVAMVHITVVARGELTRIAS